MSKVNYCTPVSSHSSKCLSFLREFFYYGHYKYTVLTDAKPYLHIGKTKQHQSGCKIFLKVALLFTGIMPLIAGIYGWVQHTKWSSYKNVTILESSKASSLSPIQTAQSKSQLKKDILAVKEGKMTLQKYATKHQDWITLLKKHGSEITQLNLRDFTNLKEVLKTLKYCPNLEILSLDGDTLTSEHVAQLAALPLTKLTNLGLARFTFKGIGITSKDVAVLVTSPIMQNVTLLVLPAQQCSGEGVKAIAESQYLKHLTTLMLDRCGLQDHDVELLVNSDNLANIEFLNVSDNYLTTQAAQSIAQSTKLQNLRQLYINDNKLGFDGAAILAKATNLDQLEALDFRFNHYHEIQKDSIRVLFKQSITLLI